VISTQASTGVFSAADLSSFGEFFKADGYGVLRGAFDADELAAFLAAVEEMQRDYERGELPAMFIAEGESNKATIGGTRVAHYLVRVTDYSPAIRALVRHPTVAEAVRLAIGPEAWAGDYFGDGFVFAHARPSRDSNYSRLGWHSDWQAQPDSFMFPCVTVTIHIDGTSPANGFLRLVPGSNHHGTQGIPEGFGKVPGEVAYYAEPGDVLLHSHLLWHSAARGSDDGPGGVRRHVRGGWYGGRRFDPDRDVNVFIKAAQY
jgi:ectoine hydroxylase-related dioxygenase (phytanoyl-CoA dioxygenase family)